MRIGLRTVKTAVGAAVAMFIVQALGIANWWVAGVLTVLAVRGTTRVSFRLALHRIIAAIVAGAMASVFYLLVGFNPWAYGLCLLFFFPVMVALRMTEGIVEGAIVATVILTNGLVNRTQLTGLLIIVLVSSAVGVFLNLFMPNVDDKIQTHQTAVTSVMIAALQSIQEELGDGVDAQATDGNGSTAADRVWLQLAQAKEAIDHGRRWTFQHYDNQILAENDYYRAYFEMRNHQYELLRTMQTCLDEGNGQLEEREALHDIIAATAKLLGEETPSATLMTAVKKIKRNLLQNPLASSNDGLVMRNETLLFARSLGELLNTKRQFALVVNAQK
ncbi:aromatic acid exporter family protein [Lacticaseibacillus pantheris]